MSRLTLIIHLEPSSTNSVALLVEKTFNLTNQNNVTALVISSIAPTLYWFKLREFGFPIPKHVWLYGTKLTNFPYREVALGRDFRQFVVILGFQHSLLLVL